MVNLPDYYELLAPSLDENPYYFCFQNVIIHISRKCALCIPQDRIEFIFDRNLEIEYNAGALYGRMIRSKSNKAIRHLMKDKVSFVSKEEIGVQAADLVAREAMKKLDNIKGPVGRPTRLATQVLEKSGRIKFKEYDRPWFERVIKESKGHHYLKSDYNKWLEGNGLQNNFANVIKYEMSRDVSNNPEDVEDR